METPEQKQSVGEPAIGKSVVALPIMETAKTIVDNATGMMWIGIPLQKYTTIEAMLILDASKQQAYVWHKQIEKTIIKPSGGLGGFRSFLGRKLR